MDFTSAPILDIPAKMREEFASIESRIYPGMRIALALGSRGISNLPFITKTLIELLKEKGAVPFIIPAMGSHGGATAQGQKEVLESYGITEEAMGVPILSSMEVCQIGSIDGAYPVPVYMDKNAYDADGVIVVNRVKAHTDFHGTHESGTVKMLTIGLGKHASAIAIHKYGVDGLKELIPLVSSEVIRSGKILGAVAILEDGYDQTSDIAISPSERIFETDAAYLLRSKQMMPRLPVDQIDVLIVDFAGKNISGTIMDTNVIGRMRIHGQSDGLPNCTRIVVLDLTPESHGNAVGIGLADVTTKRLADSIDWETTRQNVITSGFLERGFIPVIASSDKEAIEIAVNSCGKTDVKQLRLVRIRDTLHLNEIYVSAPVWKELQAAGLAEQEEGFAPISFEEDGSLR